MKSLPFESKFDVNPQGDRAVDDSTIRDVIKTVWSNGVAVINPNGSDLQVQAANGMTVNVMPGGCIIEGAIGRESSIRTISIDAAHTSLKRIDRIVARMDLSESSRNIELYKKVGTPSTTPAAPELIRQPNYYEIALADVYIGAEVNEITSNAILDQRANKELCGYVLPAFPMDFNLSEISTRWQELLESAIEGTAAGKLQNNINDLKTELQKLNASTSDVRIDNSSAENELAAFFGSSIRV
nr:MAG TPA: Receptor Binding Protein [Caudoviricetes sp.]